MATHDCPGGCGRQVQYHMYACRNDWFRLPKHFRDEIWRWYQVDFGRHADAMSAAAQWYEANPVKAHR